MDDPAESARRLEHFHSCPLVRNAPHYQRMRARRLEATGGRTPTFVPRCKMPGTNVSLLQLLAGRTLLLLGDSLTEQHFHSLACHLLAEAHGTSASLRTASFERAVSSELWKMRSCLPLANDALLCYVAAGRATEPHAPRDWILASRLRAALQPSDVVLLNVGVHFNDPQVARAHFGMLAGPLLHSASGNVSSARPVTPPPLVLFRETTPQHFDGGRFPPAKPGAGCVPLPARWREAPERNHYNEAIVPQARRDGVPILRVWHALSSMHMEHAAPPRDCTHWMLPGVTSMWTLRLHALLAARLPFLAHSAESYEILAARRSSSTRMRHDAQFDRRWMAMRRALVSLPGCVYRAQLSRHDASAATGRSEREAALVASNDSCCSAKCREEAFLPNTLLPNKHSPSKKVKSKSSQAFPGLRSPLQTGETGRTSFG